jgi:predicted nucleotidyltransferase
MVGRESNALHTEDPILQKCLEILVRLANPRRIWLYGSRARGDNGDGSDFDLALEGAALPEADRWRLELQLESLPTLKRFDLVWLENVGEELRRHIAQDGVSLYERASD